MTICVHNENRTYSPGGTWSFSWCQVTLTVRPLSHSARCRKWQMRSRKFLSLKPSWPRPKLCRKALNTAPGHVGLTKLGACPEFPKAGTCQVRSRNTGSPGASLEQALHGQAAGGTLLPPALCQLRLQGHLCPTVPGGSGSLTHRASDRGVHTVLSVQTCSRRDWPSPSTRVRTRGGWRF